jgi:hypothetical protein
MAMSTSARPVLGPIEPKDFGLRLNVDDCEGIPPASNSKVRDIASKLENVLMAPDGAGASPGQWMMGRQSAHPKLSRRASSNNAPESVTSPRSSASRIPESVYPEGSSTNIQYTPSRASSPSKPNSNRHASMSLLELKELEIFGNNTFKF